MKNIGDLADIIIRHFPYYSRKRKVLDIRGDELVTRFKLYALVHELQERGRYVLFMGEVVKDYHHVIDEMVRVSNGYLHIYVGTATDAVIFRPVLELQQMCSPYGFKLSTCNTALRNFDFVDNVQDTDFKTSG